MKTHALSAKRPEDQSKLARLGRRLHQEKQAFLLRVKRRHIKKAHDKALARLRRARGY